MEKIISSKQHKDRQFLLVLPLLVLPFISLGFWALDGGKGSKLPTSDNAVSALNLHVPEASFTNEKPLDKLALYDRADKDSNKIKKLMESDPYYSMKFPMEADSETALLPPAGPSVFSPSYTPSTRSVYKENPEVKVMQQLEALNKIIAMPESKVSTPPTYMPHAKVAYQEDASTHKLMALAEQLQGKDEDSDPELNQLDGMLDKILAIQNPERSPKVTPNESTPVYSIQQDTPYSLLQLKDTMIAESSGFYGLDDASSNNTIHQAFPSTSFPAVVHESQTLVPGATIKLRISESVQVGPYQLPAGSFVFGQTQLQQERLQISIPSILLDGKVLPVKWKVYDMDGLEGIYIPGSIERDVAKQSGGNALQSIDMLQSFNPSLGMQAANLGVQTAKGLLSKKTKLVKVQVKAGHQLIIKDVSTTH